MVMRKRIHTALIMVLGILLLLQGCGLQQPANTDPIPESSQENTENSQPAADSKDIKVIDMEHHYYAQEFLDYMATRTLPREC